jgi:uncharacterized repeat protein (TIGR01451 family)
VVAAATNPNQTTLSWTAASESGGTIARYLIERCSGGSCSNFAQIGTATALTFNDTGLSPSTSYSYRVRAQDALNVTGPYSAVATVATPAPIPAAPGNVVATPISGSQINLSWVASTETGGTVNNYLNQRCAGAACTNFAQVATSAPTTFNDTGVGGATTYVYRVRASDTGGRLSPYSNLASATTPNPTGLGFVQVAATLPQGTASSVSASYASSQTAGDLNVVVIGTNDATSVVQSVTDTAGNAYSLALGPTTGTGLRQSIYYAPNIRAGANTVTVTFTAAAAFPDLRILQYRGVNTLDVIAGASGNSGTANSGPVTTTSPNELLIGASMVAIATTAPGAGWTGRIITSPDGDLIEDQIAGAVGSYSATATVATGPWVMQIVGFRSSTGGGLAPDLAIADAEAGAFTQGQSAAYTLIVSNVGSTSTSGPVTVSNTIPAGLTPMAMTGTGWSCTLASVTCSRSDALSAAASYPPITLTVGVSPTAPPLVVDTAAVAGGGDSNSANNMATDNTAIGSGAPDTTPPSAPGTLTANAISGVEIDLSWGAATDDVGVAGYRVERCQGVGCTVYTKFGTLVTGTTFADIGLSPSTSYSYVVRAQDAAGNLGAYTPPATAATPASNPTLIAAYSFDEGSGTTLNDLSGRGNNGTIANGTWASSGKYGSALTFNGTSTMVTIPDAASLHLTTAMTLSAWVNPTANSSAWRDVIYKGVDNYYLAGSSANGGRPVIGMTITSPPTESYGTAQLALNTWTHLAATFDGTTLRLFVNGSQVSTQARSGEIVTSTNPLQIGGDSFFGQFFQGMIDEVRVYSAALTPAQIQADMAVAVGGSSPALSLSTASIDFGNQPVGSQSSAQRVTVTNRGTVDLNIAAIAITGAQAADFLQTNTCGARSHRWRPASSTRRSRRPAAAR